MKQSRVKVKKIIQRCGGQTAVANLFGISPQAVSEWVAKNWIPPGRVPRIVHIYNNKTPDDPVTECDLHPDFCLEQDSGPQEAA